MDLTLKKLPEDVRRIILREQRIEKENRGTNQYGLSSVIYKLIREWNNNCKKAQG
jgi:hypothetical protein